MRRVACVHSMASSLTHTSFETAGSRLAIEKGLKNAQMGGAGRKATFFLLFELVEEVDNKQDSLFLFFPVIGQLMLFHFI